MKPIILTSKNIGKFLAYCRMRAGESRRVVYEKTGVCENTLYLTEREKGFPQFGTIEILLDHYGYEIFVQKKSGT